MSDSTVTERPASVAPLTAAILTELTTSSSSARSIVLEYALKRVLPCEKVPEDWFFPDRLDADAKQKTEAGKRVCETCPVVAACRQWALTDRIKYGTWGALSASDRERIHAGNTSTAA